MDIVDIKTVVKGATKRASGNSISFRDELRSERFPSPEEEA